MVRQRIILAVITGGILLLILAFWSDQHSFSKFVVSPAPGTVRVTLYENNDVAGLNPEPVCYLAFTASTNDMAQIISQGRFTEVTTNSYVPSSGPSASAWTSFENCSAGRRLFTRAHPARGGLPIGRRRSWDEYLWIDGSGTNGYFLIWGI